MIEYVLSIYTEEFKLQKNFTGICKLLVLKENPYDWPYEFQTQLFGQSNTRDLSLHSIYILCMCVCFFFFFLFFNVSSQLYAELACHPATVHLFARDENR